MKMRVRGEECDHGMCLAAHTAWSGSPSVTRQETTMERERRLQRGQSSRLLIKLSGQVVPGRSWEFLLGGWGEVLLGSGREVLLLDLWRRRTSTVLVDRLLCLSSVLLGVALDGLGGVSGMLVGKALDLRCLLAGDLAALLELGIDDLLVLDVDERGKVGNKGGDQGQAPEGDKLDEEVRDEGSEEGL